MARPRSPARRYGNGGYRGGQRRDEFRPSSSDGPGHRDSYRTRSRSPDRRQRIERRDERPRADRRDGRRDAGLYRPPQGRDFDRRSRSPARNGRLSREREEPRHRSREVDDRRSREVEDRRSRKVDDRRSREVDDRRRSRERDERRRSREGDDRRHRDYDDRRRDSNSQRSSRHDSRRPDLGKSDTNLRSNDRTPPPSTEKGVDAEEMARRQARLNAWKERAEAKKREEEAQKEEGQDKEASPALTTEPAAKFDKSAFRPKPAKQDDILKPVIKDSYKAKKSAAFKPLTGDANADRVKQAPARAAKCKSFPLHPSSGQPITNTPTVPSAAARDSKMGGFGFTGKPDASAEANAKSNLLDDDEASSRKLEKLPTPPIGEIDEDAALANENIQDSEDDEIDMGEVGTEEEIAALAARRDAAETEERLDAERKVAAKEDAEMADANEESKDEAMDDEDPLDAFMAELEEQPTFSLAKFKRPDAASSKDPNPFDVDDATAEDMDTLEPEDIMAQLAAKKKKKEIKDIDHSKIEYPTFTKRFYVEPVEAKEMTEDDVANIRFELDGIKVRGKDVPKPVLTWGQCGLLTPVLSVISKLKYKQPTPIQAQAIPAIMSGRDVIGVAKTGSGKTIAFLLPMFRHIKDQPPLKTLDGPIAIILAPTRELANQIHGECKPFVQALGLRSAVCFGQQSLKDNIDALKKGVEIVVATPGRLVDLASVNSGRLLSFRRVTFFVMDEADRLWDMGFEPQVMKLLNQVRPDRQCIMFSATFPKNMEALARKVLHSPVEITVGGRSVVAPEVTQIIEVRSEKSKFHRLLEILGNTYLNGEEVRTLIFVERQETADDLLNVLLKKGYPCGSIHGGKDQVDRTSTIEDFKSGVIPIMIATSVAARGLDVKLLTLVINFNCPSHLEDYVHRVGRTGRAGEKGTAYTFITPEEDSKAWDLSKALLSSKLPVPPELQELIDEFKRKVKEGKAKAHSQGFGGKGLDKFDSARDSERSALKKQFGAKDGDDEVDEKDDAKLKAIEDKVNAIVTGASARTAVPRATASSPTPSGPSLPNTSFTIHKAEQPKKTGNKMDEVRARAAALDHRLGGAGRLRPGQPIDNRGPDAGLFHAQLEINDFPQKARVRPPFFSILSTPLLCSPVLV
jgi:ATP-dependent RNA helicase DDX46/PRP5